MISRYCKRNILYLYCCANATFVSKPREHMLHERCNAADTGIREARSGYTGGSLVGLCVHGADRFFISAQHH